MVLIVGRATSTEARALYEAFPDLSELLLLLLLCALRPMMAAGLVRSARCWRGAMSGAECHA